MPFSPLLEKTHAMTPEEEVDAVTGKNNTLISLINVYVNAVRAVIKHNLSILSLLTQWDQLHSISITTFGKLFWKTAQIFLVAENITSLSIEINLMKCICKCMKTNMRSYCQ